MSRSKDQDMCRSVLDLQKTIIMVVQTWLQKKKKEKRRKEKEKNQELNLHHTELFSMYVDVNT